MKPAHCCGLRVQGHNGWMASVIVPNCELKKSDWKKVAGVNLTILG